MKRTIREVLFEVEHAGPSAYGGEADVFAFPSDLKELQPYLVRRVREFDPAWLGYTSSLTAPKQLVGNMHVGQPLLQLEDHPQYTIIPRQQGVNLRDWKASESLKRDATSIPDAVKGVRTDMAFCQLMLDFNAQRGNPFLKLFEESYQLGLLGFGADTLQGNIFVDTESRTLALVDQLATRSHTGSPALGLKNIDRFAKKLKELQAPYHPDPQTPDAWGQQQAHYTTLIDTARDAVAASHASGAIPPVVFASTDSVQAIHLDSPPKLLVQQLKHIEQHARIPHVNAPSR